MKKKQRELVFNRFVAGESINYLSLEYDTTISEIETAIRKQAKDNHKLIQEEREEIFRRD